MIIMSLRGAFFATWQSPVRGDCFAKGARNDMWVNVNALRELQFASGRSCDPLSVLLPKWGKELYYYSYPIRISVEGVSDER
jgi:hypothetical protein